MKHQIISFIIMVMVGILFNPMNVLAYRLNDLYISLTLFYGGLLMASNMIWSHEIIHLLAHNKFNTKTFLIGIIMSISITLFLLRRQFLVNDKQWLKRMISHHSTAITTSKNIRNTSNDKKIIKLANDIIKTQEYEINLMKSYI